MTQPGESSAEAEVVKPEIDSAVTGQREQIGGWGSGSSDVAGQQAQKECSGQGRVPIDKGKEEIENYGSRREDEPDELVSPSTQIGHAASPPASGS